MMQYLVILLDDTSVAYCHCDNPHLTRRLIPLDTLRAGIRYAMKQNLMVQFVYPDYKLPQNYLDTIDTIDHHDIVPYPMDGDVVVVDRTELTAEHLADAVCVLRIGKEELFAGAGRIAALVQKAKRVNVVITDLDTFTDSDTARYAAWLDQMAETVKAEYLKGRAPQLNLLTDRMMLTAPNHCNAGVGNITLAPNGKFYLCPAFYYSHPDDSVDPQDIKNRQLLRLDHAPLCRRCDAYHCRLCVWLNRKTTREVNTPSREQCIVAHTEREAVRKMLASLREAGVFMPEVEIKELNYNDPFEVRKEW